MYLLILILAACNIPDSHPPVTTSVEYGTVISVDNCRSSKHSYYCTVETTTGRYYDLRVNAFPEHPFKPGDRLWKKTVNTGRSLRTSLCTNNYCNLSGGCSYPFPCMHQ